MKKNEQNNQRRINAKINEIFKIDLKENPSTGYGWVLSQLPSSIYLISNTYTPDPHPSGWVGSGGTRTFVFKAIEECPECEIELQYMRVWEHVCMNEFTCLVTIDDAVKYERLSDYFVKNTYEEGKKNLVISSMEEFNRIFAPAALMHTQQRWIQESDFDKHCLVAVVMPSENVMTDFNVLSIEESKKQLLVKYDIHQENISWTSRACMLLLVEKASYNEVVFIENKHVQAQVVVPETYAKV